MYMHSALLERCPSCLAMPFVPTKQRRHLCLCLHFSHMRPANSNPVCRTLSLSMPNTPQKRPKILANCCLKESKWAFVPMSTQSRNGSPQEHSFQTRPSVWTQLPNTVQPCTVYYSHRFQVELMVEFPSILWRKIYANIFQCFPTLAPLEVQYSASEASWPCKVQQLSCQSMTQAMPPWNVFDNANIIYIYTYIYIYMWVFPKIGVPPNHPFVHRVFHYFHHPFWGFSPYFWFNTHICPSWFIVNMLALSKACQYLALSNRWFSIGFLDTSLIHKSWKIHVNPSASVVISSPQSASDSKSSGAIQGSSRPKDHALSLQAPMLLLRTQRICNAYRGAPQLFVWPSYYLFWWRTMRSLGIHIELRWWSSFHWAWILSGSCSVSSQRDGCDTSAGLKHKQGFLLARVCFTVYWRSETRVNTYVTKHANNTSNNIANRTWTAVKAPWSFTHTHSLDWIVYRRFSCINVNNKTI